MRRMQLANQADLLSHNVPSLLKGPGLRATRENERLLQARHVQFKEFTALRHRSVDSDQDLCGSKSRIRD